MRMWPLVKKTVVKDCLEGPLGPSVFPNASTKLLYHLGKLKSLTNAVRGSARKTMGHVKKGHVKNRTKILNMQKVKSEKKKERKMM